MQCDVDSRCISARVCFHVGNYNDLDHLTNVLGNGIELSDDMYNLEGKCSCTFALAPSDRVSARVLSFANAALTHRADGLWLKPIRTQRTALAS